MSTLIDVGWRVVVVWLALDALLLGWLYLRTTCWRWRARRAAERLVFAEFEAVTLIAAQVRDCAPDPDRLAELVSDACERSKEMGLPDE